MKAADQASGIQRLRLLRRAWKSLTPKIDPTCSRLSRHMHALYWLNASVQSLLHEVQEKSYEDQLSKVVLPPPIFILGFWRSGTTFLHELLCCDLRFGFPSTYACLNPAHFLLSESWAVPRKTRSVRRPMDDLRYAWSSPQEDEFALLALGAPSPYEALMVPSLMRNPSSLLALQERSLKDQDLWRNTFDYFLKLLTVQQGKTMLLKSPPHGFRLEILQQMFPAARYVLIDRNPYEVFASNLKLWRTLTDRYSLEHCPDEQLEAFVLDAYILHEKAVSDGISRCVPGSFASVRYEDLVADPIGQISDVYQMLNLGDFETIRAPLETHLDKVSDHVRNHFRLSRAQKARIDAAWNEIIVRKGYAWTSTHIDLV